MHEFIISVSSKPLVQNMCIHKRHVQSVCACTDNTLLSLAVAATVNIVSLSSWKTQFSWTAVSENKQ